MPTMPYVIGMQYQDALEAMVIAGCRVLPLGYFQTDPVYINWQSVTPVKPGVVLNQVPVYNAQMVPNGNCTLYVGEFAVAVADDNFGPQILFPTVSPEGIPGLFDIGEFDISTFET